MPTAPALHGRWNLDAEQIQRLLHLNPKSSHQRETRLTHAFRTLENVRQRSSALRLRVVPSVKRRREVESVLGQRMRGMSTNALVNGLGEPCHLLRKRQIGLG